MTDDAAIVALAEQKNASAEYGPVFVDADNTLWDTDGIFAAAQLELLEHVERLVDKRTGEDGRLEFVRRLDQAIAERHHSGLRYPPRLLVQAVALALSGVEIETAARFARIDTRPAGTVSELQAEKIQSAFLRALHRLPELRVGVADGLRRLAATGRTIIVVTEAAPGKSKQIAIEHRIDQYISKVVEAPKHARLYRRVQKLVGSSSMGFMVGDQLERDIRPAKEAGLTTIYFPGGFRPRWEYEANLAFADYVVKSFLEVPGIVVEHDQRRAARQC